jgi:hypothetical protein
VRRGVGRTDERQGTRDERCGHQDREVVQALEAGINVVPAAIGLLGIGILAMGAWPRKNSYVV